jgi:uncharacterized membrane protein
MDSYGSENLDSIVRRDYSVQIGKYISEGWELFKKNAGGFIGFYVIVILINLALGKVQQSAAPLGSLISLLISGPLNAGALIVAFKLLRNRQPEFGDFFKGFNNYLPLFLVSLVSSIFIGIGTILLIIPGIYLAVSYIFAMPLVIDKKMNFWDAMEVSRKVITKNWFAFFGFVLVLILINIAGIIPFGLGLLVTIPLTTCAIAAAYADVVGLPTGSSAEL